MTLIQAAFLGLIEGITEFLPVSSTAHLLLAQRMMGISGEQVFFTTVVQLGALLGLIVQERLYLQAMLRELVLALRKPAAQWSTSLPKTKAFGVALATVPIVVAGFFIAPFLESIHQNFSLIAFMSVAVGILLAIAQLSARKTSREVTTLDLLTMGAFQVLSLIPGTSRSGIVAAGGMFRGLPLSQALEYSFILSIPALGLAGLYEVFSLRTTAIDSEVLFPTLVGTLVAFVSAHLVVDVLRSLVKRYGFLPFVAYRFLFALVILLTLG